MSLLPYLDVHSHLLPGIDDGCVSLDDSLACVGRLRDAGFGGAICTPHVWDLYPENTPANIARQVTALEEQLRHKGLDFQLWTGGEVRIAEGTISWFQQHGVPTLGPGRYVLTDYWGTDWPAYADQTMEFLLAEGYQPILAHPERMNLEEPSWDRVLGGLEQMGVWLQGNLRCLAGREGSSPQQRSQRLLAENRYQLLATDMHGPGDLDDRLAGMQTVEQLAGSAALRCLLAERPGEIISG